MIRWWRDRMERFRGWFASWGVKESPIDVDSGADDEDLLGPVIFDTFSFH